MPRGPKTIADFCLICATLNIFFTVNIPSDSAGLIVVVGMIFLSVAVVTPGRRSPLH